MCVRERERGRERVCVCERENVCVCYIERGGREGQRDSARERERCVREIQSIHTSGQ